MHAPTIPREQFSTVKPVSQVVVRLKRSSDHDRYISTIKHVLHWMSRRAGRKIPAAAWDGQSFELTDIGSQRTAAVAISEPQYWAARIDDADKTVPLRTWVTEIGIGIEPNGDVLFGTRLVASSRLTDDPFDRSVPGFIKAILSDGPVELDGIILQKTPRFLTSEADVFDLLSLLENPSRQSDVLVFSLPEGSEDESEVAASAEAVHKQTIGAAHVFILSSGASFHLTDLVGKALSVFKQAVRIYRPGFHAWVDEASNHPLALPERIAKWSEIGPPAFERWLINQTLGNSAYAKGREDRLPSFNTVRQLAAQLEQQKFREAGGTDTELLQLFEQDNEQLRREISDLKEQYDGLLITSESEREAAIQEKNAEKALAITRLHRIRELERKVSELGNQQETHIPNNLDGFESWCRDNLSGSVELANRAFQGVRKSEFHDPSFIYRALILLRDYYVPMRTEGSPERKKLYDAELSNLQLEDSATGEGIKYSSDLYSVQYGGIRRPLDRHLKGSDSRDRRYGFRLYFFWDDENQLVVVGWLPSHLDNRAS